MAPTSRRDARLRRHRRRRRSRRAIGALVLLASLVMVMAMVLERVSSDTRSGVDDAFSAAAPVTPVAAGVEASTTSHPIFRYSVIPGGVHSQRELIDALSRDPVVAAHYQNVSLNRVREARLSSERRAYVSYRVGDRIYWTTHKVTLPAGEPILTDGVTDIRERCGNCISDEPQFPTSSNEPDAVQLEARVSDPPDLLARATIPIVPSSAGASDRFATQGSLVPWSGASLGASVSRRSSVTGAASTPALVAAGERRVPKSLAPTLPSARSPGDGHAGEGFIPEGGLLPGGVIPGGVMPGGFIPGGYLPGDSDPADPAAGDLNSRLRYANTLLPQGLGAADFEPYDLATSGPEQVPPVPEPTTIVLVGTGAAGVLWRRVRRRRR